MIHTFIGDLGHFFIVVSFVSSLAATFSYFKMSNSNDIDKQKWQKNARSYFYIHAFSVIGVVVSLFIIIQNHYFEYHYAWSHSSRNLPAHFMISCFWEGQEGSFLLWIFWHALLGLVLIHTNKTWEGPLMTIFALVQAFLASMILGVKFLGQKIGSSPFILLRDAMDAPVFQTNPNFVPEDGTGLNPLLQNYWMVIHPPTLFLGFAIALVPFAYCIAGLWKKKYKEWIRPALPWALMAALTLGVGILMGAYWAYETLNFGGYWNWDPVENAVYVPWLILVAAIHTMIVFKKSNTALKTSIVLIIASFVLVLYSTFLTRSGVLGEASVHSFTDLGLSGQLLLYLLAFAFIAIALTIKAWKDIPSSQEETSTYSREFWIFIGATTLSLMGFQVLIPTSIPVYNKIVELFGGFSNMAPPADAPAFYSKFQLWFGIALALLSGTGQFFWWKKMDKNQLKEALLVPVIITLLLATLSITLSGVKDLRYILLMTVAIYSIVANLKVLTSLSKKSFKLTGGAVAHIGVAMMLIGVMFSSGYSKVVSLNTSGLLYHKDFPDEINRENVLLFADDPRPMQDYELIYKGQAKEAKGFPGYIHNSKLLPVGKPEKAIAREDIFHKNIQYFSKGDTLEVNPENTYFEVLYRNKKGEEFTLFPRAQSNPSMGGVIYSPDIKRYVMRDLYTHVSTYPDPDQETEWSEPEEITVKIGENFFLNDYVATLEEVKRLSQVPGVQLGEEDVAVQANIKIQGKTAEFMLEPIYIIKNKMAGMIFDMNQELGIKITFTAINPKDNSFSFSINNTQKDYIIMKAMEKPLINILWIGTIILVLGFGIAIRRRYVEFMQMRDKGIE
jgi:cytochrome c-type biogenesis protein CcmF